LYAIATSTTLESNKSLPQNIDLIKAFPVKRANEYRIFGGYIEKVLNQKNSPARRALIWKNFYYGLKKKRSIKNYKLLSWSANPAHFLRPELFKFLNERVQFSDDVRKLFQTS
jgi:hypothetical protein